MGPFIVGSSSSLTRLGGVELIELRRSWTNRGKLVILQLVTQQHPLDKFTSSLEAQPQVTLRQAL